MPETGAFAGVPHGFLVLRVKTREGKLFEQSYDLSKLTEEQIGKLVIAASDAVDAELMKHARVASEASSVVASCP